MTEAFIEMLRIVTALMAIGFLLLLAIAYISASSCARVHDVQSCTFIAVPVEVVDE